MKLLITTLLVALAAAPLAAQQVSDDPYMQRAIASGVCGDAPVATARFNLDENTISVTCGEDAEGFVPLLGALGPLLGGAAAAAALAAVGNAGATPDTISP